MTLTLLSTLSVASSVPQRPRRPLGPSPLALFFIESPTVRLYESFRFLPTLDNCFAVMRALIPPRGLLRGSTTTFPAFSSAPWTCRRCLSSLRKPPPFHTTKTRTTSPPQRGGKIILGVVGGTAVGAAVFGVVPDVGHTVAAVERAGRVASALALCINECGFDLLSLAG